MKTTVVTTTIYVPTFLAKYVENAKRYGRTEEVDYIVVSDLKTPTEARDFCNKIPHCTYLGQPEQEDYLQRFPELKEALPWRSIARRNVGHVYAYENGAERIVMLDDDNLSTDDDFVKGHSIVGTDHWGGTLYSMDTGWFNVCDSLKETNGVRFYPRGFPQSMKWKEEAPSAGWETNRIAVNGGLWINDPDIDAITRIERRLITTGMKPEWPTSFVLGKGTWSPWNCQNTAISREALPAYFLSPHTGRHLDIWASYITNVAMEARNQNVAFGMPLAYHDRSPHNLYRDLEQEMPWVEATDDFCLLLRSLRVKADSYSEAFSKVSDELKIWKHPVRDKYREGMQAWLETFARLGAK